MFQKLQQDKLNDPIAICGVCGKKMMILNYCASVQYPIYGTCKTCDLLVDHRPLPKPNKPFKVNIVKKF